MSALMSLVVMALLLVAPGLWVVVLCRPRNWTWVPTLGWSMAMSPVVVGGSWLLLRLIGLTPEASAVVIIAAHPVLAVSALVGRRGEASGEGDERCGRMWLVAMVGMVIAALCVPWFVNGSFRVAATHGLMHTEIVQSLESSASVSPVEPGFVGTRMNYPWLPHATIASASSAVGVPATSLWHLMNIGQCIGLGLLVWSLGCTLEWSGRLCSAVFLLMMFGVNAAGVGWRLFDGLPEDVYSWVGDRRAAGGYRKFVAFNVQPVAMLLLFAVLHASASFAVERNRRVLLLGVLALLTVGVMYPHGGPPVWLLAAIWCVTEWKRRRVGWKNASGILVLAGVIGVALTFGWLRWIGADSVGSSVGGSGLADALPKVRNAAVSVGPMLFVGLCYFVRSKVRHLGFIVVPLVISLGCGAAYCLLRLPGQSEYKMLLASGMMSAVCLGQCVHVYYRRRGGAASFGCFIAGGACCVVALCVQTIDRSISFPPTADRESPVVADGDGLRDLRLSAGWSGAARWIRMNGPVGAAVCCPPHDPNFHIWCGCPSVVRWDALDPVRTFGYNLPARRNLVEFRGIDSERYRERAQAMRGLYQSDEFQLIDGAVQALRGVAARVVLIPIEGTSVEQRRALERGSAELLFSDGGVDVWSIVPVE